VDLAGRALAIAQRRADSEVEQLARTLLDQANLCQMPVSSVEPDPGAPIAVLARRLAARLQRWRQYRRSAGIQG